MFEQFAEQDLSRKLATLVCSVREQNSHLQSAGAKDSSALLCGLLYCRKGIPGIY
jgi:hypothetical protein